MRMEIDKIWTYLHDYVTWKNPKGQCMEMKWNENESRERHTNSKHSTKEMSFA